MNCPKCGSEAGYRYTLNVHMQGAWGSPAESTGETQPTRTVRCLDCGHKTRREVAEGGGKPDYRYFWTTEQRRAAKERERILFEELLARCIDEEEDRRDIRGRRRLVHKARLQDDAE